MTNDRATDETTVVATYSARRDAEIGRDRLEGESIRAFISADDAGGAHPELQPTHGVKLVVLSSSARDAHEILEGVNMLPERVPAGEGTERGRDGSEQKENLTFSMDGMWYVTSWGYIALFALVAAAIILGLVLSAVP